MEIGGQDITIDHHSADPYSIVMRIVFVHWPNAISESYSGELFIYKDKEAQTSWNEFGLTEDNGDQLIFLTFDYKQIHCVIDVGESETFKIINHIREALENDRV